MNEQKTRKRKIRTRQSNKSIFLILLCIILIGGFFSIYYKQQKINKANEILAVEQAKLEQAKQKEAMLKKERAKMDEPDYIEKIARDEYNMVKKDEIPLFIIDKNHREK
jgi:cell division protein FtsB